MEPLKKSDNLNPKIKFQLMSFPLDWRHFLWESSREEKRIDRQLERAAVESESSGKDSKWVGLYSRLVELESKRDAIRASGRVAISGIWIEYGKVSKRKFRQAYYRSQSAIFAAKRQSNLENSGCEMVKRQYIGEENSEEVKAAAAAIDRRNELEKIDKEIKLIERKLT